VEISYVSRVVESNALNFDPKLNQSHYIFCTKLHSKKREPKTTHWYLKVGTTSETMEQQPFDFVRDQKTELPKASIYAGKIRGGTFIVTGANTGLGLKAAEAYVQQGAAKTILAVRSTSKGEEATSKIEADTGIKNVVEVWQVDMSAYSSILAFAKKVNALERLDAISENAAVALDQWSTAENGMEMTHMVNVTGTMLLAGLVLPKLQETAKKHGITPHLSIVGSVVAHQDDCREELNKVPEGSDIIDYFNDESHGLTARYALSKLILLYAVREWALRNPFSSTGVVINYVHPGLCETDLTRNIQEEDRNMIQNMRDQVGRTAEQGSRTLVHGTVGGPETHGKYVSECMPKDHYNPESITASDGQKMQRRVWESVVKHVNEVAPGTL
jgi:NAD(P)-dependent dehydrogenase (short-subunit alcohol dehydrogenase family)